MFRHQKPDIVYQVDVAKEKKRIQDHHTKRGIPKATDSNVLIATWNLTNFGAQEREDSHIELMAEVIRPFDVIAVQEIADNIEHFEKMLAFLGKDWDALYTDVAGNKERLGYLFNTKRITRRELTAELAMRGYERRKIMIVVGEEDVPKTEVFDGFNRNPYMVTFHAGNFEFTLVNVHLYRSNDNWRQLEARALADWAAKRVVKDYPPNNDLMLIGDFNMYKLDPKDDTYNEVVVEGGMKIPNHDTQIVGTNLAGTDFMDELAFFPSRTEEDFTGRLGVFDFDKVLFPDLWPGEDLLSADSAVHNEALKKRKKFYQYMRYYFADHRVFWIEFKRNAD